MQIKREERLYSVVEAKGRAPKSIRCGTLLQRYSHWGSPRQSPRRTPAIGFVN